MDQYFTAVLLFGQYRTPNDPGNVRPPWYAYAIQPIERVNMSKSVKMVEFSLTKSKSEVPFTTLNVSLKKFKVLRSDFEDLSLRVEVLDFYKK
jgi:hypothetical protein